MGEHASKTLGFIPQLNDFHNWSVFRILLPPRLFTTYPAVSHVTPNLKKLIRGR